MRRRGRIERSGRSGGAEDGRDRGRGALSSCLGLVPTGLVAALLWAASPAQGEAQRVAAGTVVAAETLQPLAGAQVQVEETMQGILTDGEGRFRIEDVDGSEVTITVTMLGYRTVSQRVSLPRTDLDIRLRATALELDALVVTGTAGGTRSRAIGNPISRVDVQARQELVPSRSIQEFLSTDVPGLRGFSAPGDVGSGGTMRIRGASSLTLSSVPVVYVDGVRIDNNPRARTGRGGISVNRLDDLNPNEIQSVEVIRGPAAATLFGTEASPGVLVITTRRGQTGDPRIDVTIRQGGNWLQNPTRTWPAAYDRHPETGEIRRFHPIEQDEALGISPFRTGHVQHYGVSLSGGVDRLQYHGSVEAGRDEGIVDWNWKERLSARTNLTATPVDGLEVQTNLGVVRSTARLTGILGELPWNLVWTLPAFEETRTRGYRGHPPEARRTLEPVEEVDRTILGGTVRHHPTPWLTHRATVGTDIGNVRNSMLVPRHPEGRGYFFGPQSLGFKEVEDVRTGQLTLDYAATASLPLTGSLSSETSAGLQYHRKRVEIARVTGQEFPVPGRGTVASAADREAFQDFIENKTLGLYVQQQAGWRDRLFLTGALRGDDNSAFGANFDFVIYPKVMGTWVVSEEDFWDSGTVQDLKLRAAWGRAGAQPDVFAARRLYEPITAFGDEPGLTPLAVGNPDLRPEVGDEVEIGFDASLRDGRWTLDFTFYNQRTTDAIAQRPVAWSAGFPGVQFVNLGEIQNRGLELGLHGTVYERPGLGWDLGLNFSHNRNRVTDMGDLPPIALSGLGQQRHVEGYPAAGIWDFHVVSARFDEQGRVVDVLCETQDGGSAPCDEAGRVFRGPSLPTWEGSATTALRLGDRLRAHALVDFMGGHKKVSGDVWGSHITFRNSLAIHERTDPILAAYDEVLNVGSPTGLMEAGFAKLREVAVSYRLPTEWAGTLGATGGSVSLAARNLATLWAAQRTAFGRRTVDVEMANQGGEFAGYYQTRMPPFTALVATIRLSYGGGGN